MELASISILYHTLSPIPFAFLVMASFSKYTAFFFLLLLSYSVQIQARESKFFSKIFHLGAKISPLIIPTPSPAPALAPAYSENQDPYYGIYGQGSGVFPPVKETYSTSKSPETITSFENDLSAEELADEHYEMGRYKKNNYYNKGYTTNNYNDNVYRTRNYDNGYTISNYNNDGYTSSNNENSYSSNYNNHIYESNYNNDGYETERQAMSDTRFVQDGKYYYDVKNENYYPNGYVPSGKKTTKNKGYYGNFRNSNWYNPNEEIQNEEEYQESLQGYVP